MSCHINKKEYKKYLHRAYSDKPRLDLRTLEGRPGKDRSGFQCVWPLNGNFVIKSVCYLGLRNKRHTRVSEGH